MIITDVDNGKLVRLYVTHGDSVEIELPITEKSKLTMTGYRTVASIEFQVDRIIDISD